MAQHISTTRPQTKDEFVGLATSLMGQAASEYDKLNGHSRLPKVMADLERFARRNDPEGIAWHYGTMIAFGIVWSVNTSRLNLTPEMALVAMNVEELLGLVYDLAETCVCVGDVTSALNDRYPGY